MKTILFLAANPTGTGRLALDSEARDIEEGLQRAKNRHYLSFKTTWAVRPRDIRRALQDTRPTIVHFSGHGAGDAGIVVESPEGGHVAIGAEALAGLFELFSDCVECVVLNACYSERQVHAVARHIPHVIGMREAVDDKAAIEFAVALYDAIGAGRDIPWAFKSAENAVALAGIEAGLDAVLTSLSPVEPRQGRELSAKLHDLFVRWTISGLLREDAEAHAYVLSAFRSLISASGESDPPARMRTWLDDARRTASEAMGLPKSTFVFLDFDIEIGGESLEVEESFFRLWKRACEARDASNMACVRLALIDFVGEPRQFKLIEAWNKRV